MSAIENLPRFLQPTLKLFLSVDLIGSTKLKHDEDVLDGTHAVDDSIDGVGARWFTSLINFYSGFEDRFTDSWTAAHARDGIPNAHQYATAAPELWKINGDELIYVLSIQHPVQIVAALYAWKDALIEYRKQLHDRKLSLDVKATAWMAGFPIGNHEVAFWKDISNAQAGEPEHAGKLGQYYRLNEWHMARANNASSEYVKDYIGPAVDTGFRIASFASARRFPVSVEIAYFLSEYYLGEVQTDESVKKSIELRFYGRESLKGVLGGIPYPIFWIDSSSPDDALTKAEDKLSPQTKVCAEKDTRDYLSLFFSDAKNKLFPPFIPKLCQLPENYQDTLQRIATVWEAESKKLSIQKEIDPPEDSSPGTKVAEDELAALKIKPDANLT